MNTYYSYRNLPEQSFGGKANGLITLVKNGFKVPRFYVVPHSTIQNIIKGKSSIEILCEEWIKNTNPDTTSLWAVRSSAEVEDGKDKSFAGIFTTEINCTPKNLATAINRVLGSFEKVQAETSEYYEKGNFEFNIIVQEMICGELSGVGFSVNPLEQMSEHPVINIIPGLGNKLVSGEEDAMMIALTEQPKILSEEEIYRGEYFTQASGYTAGTLAKDELFNKILPHLKQLKKSILEIEKNHGHPVDTEFTIHNNKIYWLQVRPITTNIPQGHYRVWDNSNMDVNYPGIVMPITSSFVQHSYSNAYLQMCRFLGAGDSFLDKNNSLFKNTIGTIHGRMYYNITSYQQLLYQMPFGKKTSKLFPKMLGADDATFKKPAQSASFFTYIKLFFNVLRTIIFFGNFKKRYLVQYHKVQQEFEAVNLKAYSHTQLIHYFTTLETQLSNYWYVPILNSLFTNIVYNRLDKILSRSRLHSKYPNFLNDALMGSGHIVSMELVNALQDLTQYLKKNDAVKKVILETETNQVLPHLKEHYFECYNQIMMYIKNFGERFDEGELKIETINYREDPSKLITFIKSNLNISHGAKKAREKFNYVDVLTESYSSNPIKLFVLRAGLKFTIKGVRDRENFRFIRTKTFDMVRQIFREMDQELLKNKSIDTRLDSLYLHFEELMYPQQFLSQYKDLIKERKSTYVTYANLEHSIRYHEVNGKFYPIEEKQPISKNGLDGVACSSGITQGKVLLVTAKNIHTLEIEGKILVAPFFEPGWIGLFSRAEGIISERGSLLSHTSILCREMGVPAIIKAKNSTKNLKNGELIKMNGATGSIEKIIY